MSESFETTGFPLNKSLLTETCLTGRVVILSRKVGFWWPCDVLVLMLRVAIAAATFPEASAIMSFRWPVRISRALKS